jgi:hypothetical protein
LSAEARLRAKADATKQATAEAGTTLKDWCNVMARDDLPPGTTTASSSRLPAWAAPPVPPAHPPEQHCHLPRRTAVGSDFDQDCSPRG